MPERLKKALIFLLKMAIAAAILYFIATSAKISWSDLASVPKVFLIAGGVCMFLQVTMTAIRWYFLMRCIGLSVSFRDAFFLTMQSLFFTLFIPAGSVSGDLVKAGMLAGRAEEGEKFNGVFSIVADRLSGLAALLVSTLFASALCFKNILDFPLGVRLITLAVIACTVIAFLLVVSLFFYDKVFSIKTFSKIPSFLDKYTRGMFSRALEVTRLYRTQWKTLVLWVLIGAFVNFTLLAGTYYFSGLGATVKTGGAPGFATTLLASDMAQSISIIPVTPGGIGTRDIMCKAVLTSSGVSDETASLMPILYTGILIIVSLFGAVFFVLDGASKKKKRSQSTGEIDEQGKQD